jgi:hypothetical protein
MFAEISHVKYIVTRPAQILLPLALAYSEKNAWKIYS